MNRVLTSRGILASALLVAGIGVAHAADLNVETLDLSKMSAGWQKPLANKSVAGADLKVAGQTFARGIGTHADSQLAINVFGTATHFSALVGIDDEAEGKGSVVFEIYADGKLKATSGVMHANNKPKRLEADITGAKQIALVAQSNDDGIDYDHADWLEPTLTLNDAAPVKPVAVEAPNLAGVDDEAPLPIFASAKPSAEPQIHGARVVGSTPGRPFLFAVPTTGEGPLKFSAKGLPTGLKIDADTGFITGTLGSAGTYTVALEVRGPRGVARRNLTLIAGAHKLAQTPPLGWNSWNIYYCGVDEDKVRAATDEIVSLGLQKHGFRYVNIDDCWQAPRLADGTIGVNTKFGEMKALGDYIHSKGLLFGIYSSPGPKTCAGYDGSYGHEDQDAKSYASWGVDYLKHDWCSYGGVADGNGPTPMDGLERQKHPYATMRRALDGASRDIVYSLCQYGMGDVWKWGADPDISANLWRTTGDIGPSYASMTNIGFAQSDHALYAGPGHWNDPDMLFLHALKPNEQLTHLTLWSLLAAPLLIGSDLSKATPFTLDALSNDEMIDIDQDPLGHAAERRAQRGSTQVWSRPLWNGTIAVGLFNLGRAKTKVSAKWIELGLRGAQPVRDVWARHDMGRFTDEVALDVPAHGAQYLIIGTPNAADYTAQGR
ncbi:alpha-galactosidase A [Abditibacteriota bacterium]|nr:alpha-galactosidase A [Abditibacteriota bacterium]